MIRAKRAFDINITEEVRCGSILDLVTDESDLCDGCTSISYSAYHTEIFKVVLACGIVVVPTFMNLRSDGGKNSLSKYNTLKVIESFHNKSSNVVLLLLRKGCDIEFDLCDPALAKRSLARDTTTLLLINERNVS